MKSHSATGIVLRMVALGIRLQAGSHTARCQPPRDPTLISNGMDECATTHMHVRGGWERKPVPLHVTSPRAFSANVISNTS